MKKNIFLILATILVTHGATSEIKGASTTNTEYAKKRVSPFKLSKKKKPTCKKTAESYEFSLYKALSKRINWEHLLRYTIDDFTNRKASTLNFFEAVGLYLYAMSDDSYKSYVIWALERLYALSPDPQLSEIILWNLACEYEKYGKHHVASEFFAHFKKIFPGSSFYWTARYKEIINIYTFCLDSYHDSKDTERVLQLAEEFIVDSSILEEKMYLEIVHIYQDLSLRIISQSLNFAIHYLKKIRYSFDSSCLFGVILRLDTIYHLTEKYKAIPAKEIAGDPRQVLYQSVLETILQSIETFFEKDTALIIPQGENYQEERAEVITHIKNNRQDIEKNSKDIVNKIYYAIELYYELKAT
jgi:hypothetical protein